MMLKFTFKYFFNDFFPHPSTSATVISPSLENYNCDNRLIASVIY